MQEAVGPRVPVSEQDRRLVVEALKLLTGLQRQLSEVKHRLDALLKT
jgi:hypothetical protein